MSVLPNLPEVGDIVLCRFPEDETPGMPGKGRPALVLSVRKNLDGHDVIYVLPGTTNTSRMYPGEFVIAHQHGEDYLQAGLNGPTKFKMNKKPRALPWVTEWFVSPKGRDTPILGSLTDNAYRRLELSIMEARAVR